MNEDMYKVAWKEENVVFYIDAFGNKYVAKGGNLAWRINNPGLMHHRCHFAKKNGVIGVWKKLAIFPTLIHGHQALQEWLHSKKHGQSDLYAIGKYYQPENSEQFVQKLAASSHIPPKTKIKDLPEAEFAQLLVAIEELCGFVRSGDEEFYLLPKIAAKIEYLGKEDLYLVGSDLTLTKKEAMDWIASQRLDAVIVHHLNGGIHLRSRPRYRMQTLKLTSEQHCEVAGELKTLARAVGEKAPQQCIWGFVNGISNTKNEAIESCSLISQNAGNELVLSLPNDMRLLGIKEVSSALLLKLGVDTPVVKHAVGFLKYLLMLSKSEENNPPVVVFAHSQGAAIVEHALALLTSQEKQQIRIFTFGGWSFILPGVAHPESHNYASVGDIVPRVGRLNLQYLAMRKYEGLQEGLNEEQVIGCLAFQDAIQDIDSLNPHILDRYARERLRYYQSEFEKIRNVTIVDSESMWEHSFRNESYQTIVRTIVEKYRSRQKNIKGAIIQEQPVRNIG